MRTRLGRIASVAVLVAVVGAAARLHRAVWPRQPDGAPIQPVVGFALGVVLARRRLRDKRAEQREAVFSNLGQRLSAARTPREAAQSILEAADLLWQWDACVLELCSAEGKGATTVLCIDTINGRRAELSAEAVPAHLGPVARRALKQGPQLVLRRVGEARFTADMIPFGDKARPSVSLMYVPVRKDSETLGLLSVQSYQPNAYSEADLRTLQARADHCAGALDRIRAEAALSESNERLRLALAAGKMGTWTLELNNGQRMLWSAELEAIVGLKRGEFAGTEQALYEFIHPEDRELVRQAFEKAIQSRGDYEVEFRFLPRGHPPGWMLGRGRAYYDDSGKAVRLVGVAIDITARKLMEGVINRLNTELERRVRQRTEQLEGVNQELEAFAYSVSHDLRAPLRAIRGFSEVLLERYTGQLDAEGQDFLQRICDSSRRMGGLIDDLLKLSRLGRSELRWQAVNLSRLAEATAAELRKADPGRTVEFAIEPNLRAEGDEQLLGVVLNNLLGNAWKFTRPRPQARIAFGFTQQPEPAFFVRDNGIGFDMAHAGKLFGVFQRLPSASEFPGSGIGLATVQRIIRRHCGRTWAAGVVNQGTTVYFTLPGNRDFEL